MLFLLSVNYSFPAPLTAWQARPSEIKRKRNKFQDLTAKGVMTKEELRSKLKALEQAHAAAERELRLARERSERLSTLEQHTEDLLETYAKTCVENPERALARRAA